MSLVFLKHKVPPYGSDPLQHTIRNAPEPLVFLKHKVSFAEAA